MTKARKNGLTSNNLVSIIIVSWNGLPYIKGCMRSLSKISYKKTEVIIIDNNSDDGTYDYIKKYYPKTKIIRSPINTGFAEGNNIGYDYAIGEFILFLNNDTLVDPNFLEPLVDFLKTNENAAGVQSRILFMDKPYMLDSVATRLTPLGILYYYGISKTDSSKYHRIIPSFSLKGACMLFKKSALTRVHVDNRLFDPDSFAYYEESDLCHRIWLTGKKLYYIPQSVILHKMGATSTSLDNSFIQYHSFKNRLRSLIKNLQLSTLLWMLPAHILVCELFAVISLLNLKFSRAVAIQKSLLWNILVLKDTLRIRILIQRNMRNIPDALLFREILISPPFAYYLNLFNGLTKYDDSDDIK